MGNDTGVVSAAVQRMSPRAMKGVPETAIMLRRWAYGADTWQTRTWAGPRSPAMSGPQPGKNTAVIDARKTNVKPAVDGGCD